MMSGSILYPPHDPANDVAVLFIETSGCLPMCGHGTIGTITIAIEEGLIRPREAGKVRMETPAGLVFVTYHQEGKKVKSVKLINVPAYLDSEGLEAECPDLGMLRVDVAYGGNFLCYRRCSRKLCRDRALYCRQAGSLGQGITAQYQ